MIPYETWCQIRHCIDTQHLNLAQTAKALKLHSRTVGKWSKLTQYQPRKTPKRSGVLDLFKGQIIKLTDAHAYSAQQVFQRLREAGYTGSLTTVGNYLHLIRKKPLPAFLKLMFAAGEAAQVDWGEYGTIQVGGTRRKLSFFVMVLCFSRRQYLEFTVMQTMEHFLAAHEHAFAAFGGVPSRIIIDNLKTGVIEHMAGCAPVFNQRYLDYARHCGFTISACNVAKGNEKGRVENAVGYIKKNFLNGLELTDFCAVNPAAALWLETVANVRIHRTTGQRPIDLFEQEKAHLLPLNPMAYDIARIKTLRVSPQFRVAFDTNHYSVPPRYVGITVTLKITPEWICIYHDEQLIARHKRCYDRSKDIEDPDHPKVLVEQRGNAKAQRLLLRFLAFTPKAEEYHKGLEAGRLNWRAHIAKINALADIYGDEPVARAIEDALTFGAFSCEYITNLLEVRARALPQAAPLQLTRRHDLLDLELAPPDLSLYEASHHAKKDTKK